ncbi:hypothetical protein A3J91_02740 [Candidatus Peribacteria bacterium RIFOXYC2_FULL_58_10]|nr:MAG: hypothetical protein A2529_05450 [Candidatus Peribacteria bacterium RIFOXYD2_FULL_58_15]OGJ83878.1 MAG: hypothetical protein A3J91_02740 [Candidatus Peribacteria bacterium RIFOXYC2_FULL_58_10]HAS34246.1 hypothetical protein [Candidatus Peribacteria bacterium]
MVNLLPFPNPDGTTEFINQQEIPRGADFHQLPSGEFAWGKAPRPAVVYAAAQGTREQASEIIVDRSLSPTQE